MGDTIAVIGLKHKDDDMGMDTLVDADVDVDVDAYVDMIWGKVQEDVPVHSRIE